MNLNRRQFIVAVGAAALASPRPKEGFSQTNSSTSVTEGKMTQTSTISLERLTPKICKIKFSNPPVNLIGPETVSRLHEVVRELSEDAQVQVVIFTSSISDYFFNGTVNLSDLWANDSMPVRGGAPPLLQRRGDSAGSAGYRSPVFEAPVHDLPIMISPQSMPTRTEVVRDLAMH